MANFIVRYPTEFVPISNDIKGCVKEYLKHKFDIGNIIEAKRMYEINTIIIDQMNRNTRSVVNVDYINPFNPNLPNKIKISSMLAPFNIPLDQLILGNKIITGNKQDGLIISPSRSTPILVSSPMRVMGGPMQMIGGPMQMMGGPMQMQMMGGPMRVMRGVLFCFLQIFYHVC